jgi:hypothetical protein|nr:MAG TPA: type I restriction enzyme [Caudoviricetes sp.]
MSGYYGWVRLPEIARVERCRSGVIYPARTVYIQVSACAKNSAKKWHITESAGELPGKFAAVIPTVPVLPWYLKEALEYSADEFFCRYIGSNINIQMELFGFYTLPFYSDLKEQARVVDMLKPIEYDIEYAEKELEAIGDIKKYFLSGMMV